MTADGISLIFGTLFSFSAKFGLKKSAAPRTQSQYIRGDYHCDQQMQLSGLHSGQGFHAEAIAFQVLKRAIDMPRRGGKPFQPEMNNRKTLLKYA